MVTNKQKWIRTFSYVHMVWAHIIHNRAQSIALHISFGFTFRRAFVILCHILIKENITCFYNNDINHVSPPYCVLLLWYPKVTENLWQNCCIERLYDWFILWTQKKSVWLLTADHVATCCPEFVFYFIFFYFSSSAISIDKLISLSDETWQSHKLWYFGSTLLWMHALNNLD